MALAGANAAANLQGCKSVTSLKKINATHYFVLLLLLWLLLWLWLLMALLSLY